MGLSGKNLSNKKTHGWNVNDEGGCTQSKAKVDVPCTGNHKDKIPGREGFSEVWEQKKSNVPEPW